MSKNNLELLEKRLGNIRKGSYFSGFIGILSIGIGLSLILFSFEDLMQKKQIFQLDYYYVFKMFGSPFLYVIYGWIFLFLKDAFQSIEALISEISEIV